MVIKDKPLSSIKADIVHAFLSVSPSPLGHAGWAGARSSLVWAEQQLCGAWARTRPVGMRGTGTWASVAMQWLSGHMRPRHRGAPAAWWACPRS